MFKRSTIQLLRFPFSLFLLPVYLFALSQLREIDIADSILVFIILHVLVYPSSNGYNSYMDRDSGPIGLIQNPLLPTRQLFYITILLDTVAIILSLLISYYFTAAVIIYILASRAYSYRGIRLKKYPVAGYLTVITCQGALVFFASYHGCSIDKPLEVPLLPMIISSLLIGGYYPLTQVFQHEEDRKDGVKTISMVLGKKQTFIFCGIVFAIATLCMYLTFRINDDTWAFLVFLICMTPMMIYFIRWMLLVRKDERNANFRFSLNMNILASVCTSLFFGILIIMK